MRLGDTISVPLTRARFVCVLWQLVTVFIIVFVQLTTTGSSRRSTAAAALTAAVTTDLPKPRVQVVIVKNSRAWRHEKGWMLTSTGLALFFCRLVRFQRYLSATSPLILLFYCICVSFTGEVFLQCLLLVSSFTVYCGCVLCMRVCPFVCGLLPDFK